METEGRGEGHAPGGSPHPVLLKLSVLGGAFLQRPVGLCSGLGSRAQARYVCPQTGAQLRGPRKEPEPSGDRGSAGRGPGGRPV